GVQTCALPICPQRRFHGTAEDLELGPLPDRGGPRRRAHRGAPRARLLPPRPLLHLGWAQQARLPQRRAPPRAPARPQRRPRPPRARRPRDAAGAGRRNGRGLSRRGTGGVLALITSPSLRRGRSFTTWG